MKSTLTVRLGAGLILQSLLILNAGCSGLVKVSDASIPRLSTPIASATFDELLGRLKPFFELESMRASKVNLRFDDLESAERYREAEAAIAMSRPDKIRLIINIPYVSMRIAEMVSENDRFRVAIYLSEYRRFLTGTNKSDYSAWRNRLGEQGRSAIISARPFHFTEALLIRPFQLENERYAYSLEEALVEEPDPDPKARKGSRILRSHYVITEIEQRPAKEGAGRVSRKFWFDRTSGLSFTRQQIFDDQGLLQTEVTYSSYRLLDPASQTLWPGMIQVSRPHDSYQARLLFNEAGFQTNVQLPPNAFLLENNEGLPETDLDKPASTTPPPAVAPRGKGD